LIYSIGILLIAVGIQLQTQYLIRGDSWVGIVSANYIGQQDLKIFDKHRYFGHYPFFWTSSTHLDGVNPYSGAAYIAFGKALGKMNDVLMDVHGAGAQRSDRRTGSRDDFPSNGRGPQGDEARVFNMVRPVRSIK